MSTDTRKEIERILKELIAEYGDTFMLWWHDKLYYKIGGKMYYEDMDEGCGLLTRDICRLKKLIQKMRQLAIENPEYVVYVGSRENVILDHEIDMCINHASLYFNQIEPLVPMALQPALTPDEMSTLGTVFDVDPLTQVLDYAMLKLASESLSHSYVCPQISFIEREHDDLGYLSMGSAKRGVVAYCTTFDDYIHKIISGQWELLDEKLTSLWVRISTKLEDYGKQISSLSKKKRKKYCDVYAIKDLVSIEIEEADKLIKQYGIIRVAFPLD